MAKKKVDVKKCKQLIRLRDRIAKLKEEDKGLTEALIADIGVGGRIEIGDRAIEVDKPTRDSVDPGRFLLVCKRLQMGVPVMADCISVKVGAFKKAFDAEVYEKMVEAKPGNKRLRVLSNSRKNG